MMIFFFSSRRRHTRSTRDWSSDVCSSDLNPAAGETDERVPIAGKRQLEDDAQHAVVVVLDLGVETLAAFENQRLDRFDDRGTLEADVSGSGVLEAGLLAAGAENVAEGVEADLFADVELHQDQDRALQ